MTLTLLSGIGFKNRQCVDRDAIETLDHPLAAQKRIFWTSHSRLGYLTLTAGAIFVLSYFAATPDGPHRPTLFTISSFTLVASVVALTFIERPDGSAAGGTSVKAGAVKNSMTTSRPSSR